MKHAKHILKVFAFISIHVSIVLSFNDQKLEEVKFDTLGRVLGSKKSSSKKHSSSKSSKKESRHRHCLMRSDFHTDRVSGYIKAQYVNEETVDFNVRINLRDFQPDGQVIMDGSQISWHLHTDWKNRNIHSGSNDQCAKSLTGNHYDPTVACGPASEWVNSNGICYGPQGQIADSVNYSCTPTSNWRTSCERGDISGKLGPFVVDEKSNGYHEIYFKGRNTFFATEREAYYNGHHWSFVLHYGPSNTRILCAKVEMYC